MKIIFFLLYTIYTKRPKPPSLPIKEIDINKPKIIVVPNSETPNKVAEDNWQSLFFQEIPERDGEQTYYGNPVVMNNQYFI